MGPSGPWAASTVARLLSLRQFDLMDVYALLYGLQTGARGLDNADERRATPARAHDGTDGPRNSLAPAAPRKGGNEGREAAFTLSRIEFSKLANFHKTLTLLNARGEPVIVRAA
jgi:hypothetical protein